MPTTNCVTPCSRAAASNAFATSSPVVITTSAPNCRASDRFFVSRVFSSSFNGADVSTYTAIHGASIAAAIRRVQRINNPEYGLGPTPTASRCPDFHGAPIRFARITSRNSWSTCSAVVRNAISRSAVRFSSWKKFSDAVAARSPM